MITGYTAKLVTKWNYIIGLKSNRYLVISIVAICFGISYSSCVNATDKLKLAITTSTYNSGLFDVLAPKFKLDTGIDLYILSIGTGRALRLGCTGDVDVVLVHSKKAELEFIEQGCGLTREEIMYNRFILVGPQSDPAVVKNDSVITKAFKKIRSNRAKFVSRGDDSGTHKREQMIWNSLGLEIDTRENADWYIESGLGMGNALIMAHELNAYTLSDSSTFLAFKHKIRLSKLAPSGELLKNIYSIIIVNPKMHPKTNIEAADKFLSWIKSKSTKQLIDTFKVGEETLFKTI